MAKDKPKATEKEIDEKKESCGKYNTDYNGKDEFTYKDWEKMGKDKEKEKDKDNHEAKDKEKEKEKE